MKQQVITLAQDLIRRPSISPKDEGCQQVIADRLSKLGFNIEWMPFGDTLNLWATHGDSAPTIVLPDIPMLFRPVMKNSGNTRLFQRKLSVICFMVAVPQI